MIVFNMLGARCARRSRAWRSAILSVGDGHAIGGGGRAMIVLYLLCAAVGVRGGGRARRMRRFPSQSQVYELRSADRGPGRRRPRSSRRCSSCCGPCSPRWCRSSRRLGSPAYREAKALGTAARRPAARHDGGPPPGLEGVHGRVACRCCGAWVLESAEPDRWSSAWASSDTCCPIGW